jgi:ribonuclease BN (tRNA processing enzyme)
VLHARRALLLLAAAAIGCRAEPAKVVLLGSGTPIPDAAASGPGVAIVMNGRAYLFDAGAGIVRQVETAAERLGIAALDPRNLSRLFLTHLHSDHTLGYPDLILTPWVVGRMEALEVYGPPGTEAMTRHIQEAYEQDIRMRRGAEGLSARGLRVHVHEISAGPVYEDASVRVRAVAVRHGSWQRAFGYAVEAGGRTVVISGDTAPSASIEQACRGCDVLVHEVYSAAGLRARFGRGGPGYDYHRSFHTSTRELAEIASRCRPKLLVLYHQLYFGPKAETDLENEIRQTYSGTVVNGRDFAVY